MKFDTINIIQLVLLFIFLANLFYIAITLKQCKKNFNVSLIKNSYIKAVKYGKNLTIKNYLCYEKYDVWRYCELF
ncbi:hypothetical protein [Haloimpatiens massiliensis]|uniref:hypothetical protein n=1 Tax=Haloimpatiens massiliensis TaxID=1658110 RepID=UPI000C8165E1|nr:hypothetical protein [Haloimpatiens massiliensis]